jgi:hypothetical protein
MKWLVSSLENVLYCKSEEKKVQLLDEIIYEIETKVPEVLK